MESERALRNSSSPLSLAALLAAGFYASPAFSLDDIIRNETGLPDTTARDVRPFASYPAGFFQEYRPLNALDMVERLPGFQLEDGEDEIRGLGGAAGNVLIDDRRPTAKQDTIRDILGRIPAGHVASIDLIRTGGAGIDMGGYSALANVVLREDVPAVITWELKASKNFEHGPVTPEGRLSLNDNWGPVVYTAGLFAKRFAFGELGPLLVESGTGTVSERRFDDSDTTGLEIVGNLSATIAVEDTLFRLNTEYGCDDRVMLQRSERTPQATGVEAYTMLFGEEEDQCHLEIGGDIEKSFAGDFLGKAIFLYGHGNKPELEWERTLGTSDEPVLFQSADTDRQTSEKIARFELLWSGIPDQAFQVDLELANNILDNTLLRTIDAGEGPTVSPVPGANGRVEEVRADLEVGNTWFLDSYTIDLGIGGEVSRISQRGDISSDRSFAFLTPSAVFTHSAESGTQTRLRIAREVSQLDFENFVSETNFEDDDLALGNPALRPETSWLAELSIRQQLGSAGTVMFMGFHNWISDVEDLLPISPVFEVPGNLGDGRRWGVELESTLALEELGLMNARLDIGARWQDSSVEDPVTGRTRVLSDEREYDITIEYRQDFDAERWAWGWRTRLLAERPFFKVNELDVHDDGTELNLYIETTRWLGTKIRISLEDLLNRPAWRDRTIFTAQRYLSPVDYIESRERARGRRLTVGISGSF